MRKKKVFRILVIALTIFFGQRMFAQDCERIVLPRAHYSREVLAQYPAAKLGWCCTFSQCCLGVADDVPNGTTIYDLSVLYSYRIKRNISNDFIINIDTLSYYEFNFGDYQPQEGASVYFRTPGSAHVYLVLRPYMESLRRTEQIEASKDYPKE